MPVFIGIIIALFVGLLLYDTNQQFAKVVNLVGLGILALVVLVPLGIWISEQSKKDEAKRERERLWKEQDEERARVEKALHLDVETKTQQLYREATRPYLLPLAFTDMVRAHLELEIQRAELPQPSAHLWDVMLSATRRIYEQSIPQTSHLPSPELLNFDHQRHLELQMQYQPFADFSHAYDDQKFGTAFVKAFMSYLRVYPKEPKEYQFTIPITDMVDTGMLISEMTTPFSQVGFQNAVSQHTLGGAQQAWMEQGKKGDPLIYANRYEGEQDITTLYLHPMLQPLFWEEVPWGISDQARTQHHRALGRQGTGKTTFLSHFVLHDLPKVIEGKASLVVIDSQRLARQISRTKLFAKDQPFYDHVVIADPTPEYALALNPFAIKKPNGERDLEAGIDILSYALSGVATEVSETMADTLYWIIRGTAYHPEARLDLLLRYFDRPPKGKSRSYPFPEHYNLLDNDTRHFFENIYPTLPAVSFDGLHRRLFKLTQSEALSRMLNASECRFDLYSLLHNGGTVLLVDTAEGKLEKDEREVFGRLFIVMLERLVKRRGDILDENSLKHIFVLIDEAHDYIRTDERFGDMFVKARTKRVCLTVAHHFEDQIENLNTKNALAGAFIRTECTARLDENGNSIPNPAVVHMGNLKNPTIRTVPFKKFEWKQLPPISDREYHEMRQHVFSKFGDRGTRTPPAPRRVPLVSEE